MLSRGYGYGAATLSLFIFLESKRLPSGWAVEIFMSDNSKDRSAPLSEEELAKANEILAEIRRKLSLLLADPRTPETFKDAFTEVGE